MMTIYNLTSGLLTRSSPSNVRYSTGTSVGNLAIFGGFISPNGTAAIEFYNPTTETRWTVATIFIPTLMTSVGNLTLFVASGNQVGEIKLGNSSKECQLTTSFVLTTTASMEYVTTKVLYARRIVESLRSCYADASTPCEDDGLHCNGIENCDGQGNCIHSGSPCPTARCYLCDESINQCKPSPPFSQCNGDNVCNGDNFRDASGQCLSNGTFASPGTVCLEDAICDGEGRCVSDSQNQEKDSTDKMLIGVLVPLFAIITVTSIVIFLLWRRRRNSSAMRTDRNGDAQHSHRYPLPHRRW